MGGLKGDTSCGDVSHVKSLPLNMKGPIIVQTVETTTTNLSEYSGCMETATLPKQDQTVPQKNKDVPPSSKNSHWPLN